MHNDKSGQREKKPHQGMQSAKKIDAKRTIKRKIGRVMSERNADGADVSIEINKVKRPTLAPFN
jgi:hypothetical protein